MDSQSRSQVNDVLLFGAGQSPTEGAGEPKMLDASTLSRHTLN